MAQSIGLRRWRVGDCSSKASDRMRLCGATSGGGNTTLALGLPPGYTASKYISCSPIIKPPKNVVRMDFHEQRKETQKFPRYGPKLSFHLQDTARGLKQRLLLREK